MITKLDYIEYKRCPKSFFLHQKKDVQNFSDYDLKKKSEGDSVELLARQRFPEGVAIQEELSWDEKVNLTKELILKNNIIYGACFSFEDYYIRVDILKKKGSLWEIIEVKSALSNDIYNLVKKDSQSASAKRVMHELAYQKFLLNKLNIESEASVLMINMHYERKENLDLERLFEYISVEKKISLFVAEVEEDLNKMNQLIKEQDVSALVGGHCKKPIPCAFQKECWKNISKKSFHHIPKISPTKREACTKKAYEDINQDLLNDHILAWTDLQKQDIDRVLKNKVVVNKPRLMMTLQRYRFPLNFLDFETFAPSIPPFAQTKAYEDIPYQYSLHHVNVKNEISHFEYINEDKQDPRRRFALKLIEDLEMLKGPIVVYNAGFEGAVLERLSEIFPDLQNSLKAIKSRLLDLMIIFKEKYFYHPEMVFSYSLKAVLPALVPSFSYKNLKVQNGLEAMSTYFKLIESEDENIKKELREALSEYCQLDSLSMYEILKVIKKY